MFKIIESFYNQSDFGLVASHFINLPFESKYQSSSVPVANRLQAYPCHETVPFEKSEINSSVYKIFKDTFEKQTGEKIIYLKTFLRKIKLSELKQSAVYKKDRPHVDDDFFDYAGIVYFSSNSIIDGTKIYNDERDFEPTLIVGSKVNRCFFYNTQIPHSTPFDQYVEERWVQPFFLIVKEKTYMKFKNKYAT